MIFKKMYFSENKFFVLANSAYTVEMPHDAASLFAKVPHLGVPSIQRINACIKKNDKMIQSFFEYR